METTTIFKHMVIGDVKKIATDTLSTNVISTNLEESPVFHELVDALEAENPLSEFIDVANHFLEQGGEAIQNTEQLYALLPKLKEKIQSLANGEVPTIDEETYATEEVKKTIWINAIVHHILKTKLSTELNQAIKIIELIEKSQQSELESEESKLMFWKKSIVVFPKPVFPLPKPILSVPEIQEEAESTEIAELTATLNELVAARGEIIEAYQKQKINTMQSKMKVEEYRTGIEASTKDDFSEAEGSTENEPIDVDALFQRYSETNSLEFLDTAYFTSFSRETTEILSGIGFDVEGTNMNMRIATNKLDELINANSRNLSRFVRPDLVALVGDFLVSLDRHSASVVSCFEEETLTHCGLLSKLMNMDIEEPVVQVLGIGYANIIRQNLIRYESDEIAHIENILAGESKEKSHRNLKRNEESFFSETEKSNETETNNKSSDRFEMSKELSSVVAQSTQFGAGLTLSGGYGPISVTASLDYSTTSSSVDAENSSVNQAKEITNEIKTRIQERVLERRTSTTINEVEIINTHKVDNTASTDHINGFYYWVDKVYENQVYNTGRRLMLEFMIPEPAAYHVFSQFSSKKQGVTIEKPVSPKEVTGMPFLSAIKTHRDINRDNFHLWASLYNVQDIPVPPTQFSVVSKAYSMDPVPGAKNYSDKEFNDLQVPEGYKADSAVLGIAFSAGSGRYISGHIGRKYFSVGATMLLKIVLDEETGIVPFSFRGKFTEYAMNVEILCSLNETGYEKWQISVFNAIMKAYEQQKAEYDNQVSSMELGVTINGANPRVNKKVMETELKKWSIEMLTQQRFENFNAMLKASDGNPEIDFEKSIKEGSFIKFFEQSIEWQNMTYLFYPYFWAKRNRWSTIKQFEDSDPKFSEFLKAGYARVVVPVHPKYTAAILHYMESGEIWLGEEMPGIDDELYLSIVDIIKNSEDATDDDPVGDPWETRIPTNMVMVTSAIPDDLPGS